MMYSEEEELLTDQVDEHLTKAVKDMIHNNSGEELIQSKMDTTLIGENFYEYYPSSGSSDLHLVDINHDKARGIMVSDFEITMYSMMKQENGRTVIYIDRKLVRNVVFHYDDDESVPNRDDFSIQQQPVVSFLPAILPAAQPDTEVTEEQKTRKGFVTRITDKVTSFLSLITSCCCCGGEEEDESVDEAEHDPEKPAHH